MQDDLQRGAGVSGCTCNRGVVVSSRVVESAGGGDREGGRKR